MTRVYRIYVCARARVSLYIHLTSMYRTESILSMDAKTSRGSRDGNNKPAPFWADKRKTVKQRKYTSENIFDNERSNIRDQI